MYADGTNPLGGLMIQETEGGPTAGAVSLSRWRWDSRVQGRTAEEGYRGSRWD